MFPDCNDLMSFINKKVILHCGRSRHRVVICEIGECYLKAIEVGTGNTRIFNLDRIDIIEEV
jgi:hypothetical protein